ncbi:MAG TPA: hypothetical protein VFH54_12685 [Mycobacteriales bacterium]|nr:hypothetical protein [Mycobacteriales bacterium]
MGAVETAATEKFVRDLLNKGRSITFVANACGWPEDRVRKLVEDDRRADEAIAAEAAQPKADVVDLTTNPPSMSLPAMRQAARDAVEPRQEFKARATNAVELLARADSIDDRRIKAALGRARKAMTDLAGLVAKHDEQGAARARIAQLEQELAAAKAALRGNRTRARTRGADDQAPPPGRQQGRARVGCGQRSRLSCRRPRPETHRRGVQRRSGSGSGVLT